eukprot:GHVU01116834.1.p1 GENE.GHVU01116834.1~~GHVU01116834.1.p1  ORF type:complete len:532 (+),score=56.48 GHVU01116834.1:163-1596(+)
MSTHSTVDATSRATEPLNHRSAPPAGEVASDISPMSTHSTVDATSRATELQSGVKRLNNEAVVHIDIWGEAHINKDEAFNQLRSETKRLRERVAAAEGAAQQAHVDKVEAEAKVDTSAFEARKLAGVVERLQTDARGLQRVYDELKVEASRAAVDAASRIAELAREVKGLKSEVAAAQLREAVADQERRELCRAQREGDRLITQVKMLESRLTMDQYRQVASELKEKEAQEGSAVGIGREASDQNIGTEANCGCATASAPEAEGSQRDVVGDGGCATASTRSPKNGSSDSGSSDSWSPESGSSENGSSENVISENRRHDSLDTDISDSGSEDSASSSEEHAPPDQDALPKCTHCHKYPVAVASEPGGSLTHCFLCGDAGTMEWRQAGVCNRCGKIGRYPLVMLEGGLERRCGDHHPHAVSEERILTELKGWTRTAIETGYHCKFKRPHNGKKGARVDAVIKPKKRTSDSDRNRRQRT